MSANLIRWISVQYRISISCEAVMCNVCSNYFWGRVLITFGQLSNLWAKKDMNITDMLNPHWLQIFTTLKIFVKECVAKDTAVLLKEIQNENCLHHPELETKKLFCCLWTWSERKQWTPCLKKEKKNFNCSRLPIFHLFPAARCGKFSFVVRMFSCHCLLHIVQLSVRKWHVFHLQRARILVCWLQSR